MDTHSEGENPDNEDDGDSDGDDIEAQLAKDHSKVKADDVKTGASAANATKKRFRERLARRLSLARGLTLCI